MRVRTTSTRGDEMEVELDYVSVGCNRTPQCVDWYDDHTLAYGAGSLVTLAEVAEDDSKAPRAFATLHAHKDRVNCLTWIRLRSKANDKNCPVGELVTGSVDKSIVTWKRDLDNQYVIGQILEGHTSSVTAIAATYVITTPAVCTVMASASSDSSVIIWLRDNIAGQFTQLQTISFGRGFIMALDFYLLPECDVPLLVCGGDDSKLYLFTPSADDNGKYCRVLTLPGHEDWIRSVSMIQEMVYTGDILIASSGQDMFVRVWRLSKELTKDSSAADDELKVKKNSFTLSSLSQQYNFVIGLETVLLGHEDWVYSVCWQPPTDAAIQPLRLLSASMDKTMILWQPDADTGVWLEQVRVGEVGGNSLGLYGAIFSPRGNQILAHGYQGAFHLWRSVSNHDDKSIEKWEPCVIMGGHFDSVVDITWEPHNGHYLVSVSSDQTARLHAMWKQPNQVTKSGWYEISRPQIHGYDMHCVAMVTPYLYVSGAEEKVIRVFQSPAYFLDCLATISGANITKKVLGLPLGASVPPLGLSNKAVYTEDHVEEKPSTVKTNIFTEPELPSFEAVSLKAPPFEEHLVQNTLWPEVQKLYGHGFEVFCVAASHDGSLVASASKAAKQEHAAIRIWDVSSWCQRAVLTHHTLTVTQLSFSHNGAMLLAVSRDRCWSLWKRNSDDDKELFSLAAYLDPKSRLHSRIIWSCSWSHDDKCFVTASRDKKVIIWSNRDVSTTAQDCTDNWRPVVKPLECSDAATAVDFAPCCCGKDYLLAIGLDDGTILLGQFDWNKITITVKFNQSLCHASTIKRLAWQPWAKHSTDHSSRLASCSSDHCVKIFNVLVK